MELNLETIFWISAVVGTTFFILKTSTMFLGLGEQFGIDIDDGSDLHGLDNVGSVIAFKFLSLTGITTFLMMFGWGGLVGIRQYQLDLLPAGILALVSGVIAVLVIAVVFKYSFKLESRGAHYSKDEIIGLNAQVYVEIPAEGTGQIQINVGGMIREMDAKSADRILIPSHQQVQVVQLLDNNTVLVKIHNS